MNLIYHLSRIIAWLVVVSMLPELHSQIIIEPGPDVTPDDMVEKIIGEGIWFDNVTFQGADVARGIFSDGDATSLGISSGIFLNSGCGNNIPGPNNECGASCVNGTSGHPTLNTLTTYQTFDAAVLEFDFIPFADTIRLNYVFGSEEYNEFVGSTYNDVFGIFITGPSPAGGIFYDKNIALVPGTINSPVKINNVNNGYAPCGIVPTGPCTNCAYFIDNTGGITLEYDAQTTLLTAWLLVVPCETYHIKIGVADAGDGIYDSGIFIEENSLNSPGREIETEVLLDPPGLTENMVEGHVNASVVFRLQDVSLAPLTVCFDITSGSGYALNGLDYEYIDNCISFEEGQDSAVLTIIPLFDGFIEGEETIQLIIENTLGCVFKYDTLNLIIEDYWEMNPIMSPNSILCKGQEVEIGVALTPGTGYPPYTFFWEPGGYIEDTITISPLENTTFVVTITDLFGETAQDSVQIIVFPVCDLASFYFEASLNPGLPYDVYGDVTDDTVFVVFPAGTNLNALIPSYTFDNEICPDTVGPVNDFTSPVVYEFIGPGGCSSQWVVIADIETGGSENVKNSIAIFPNPASDQITITHSKDWDFDMYNAIGNPVLKCHISNQFQAINISEIEPGLYFLKFQKENIVFVKRLIVSK